MSRLLLFLLCAASLCAQPRRLLVISIDGLDHRYLRDADALGLRIPTLRRLMKEGAWAEGVLGIVPTVTWPSHTTIITGVPAARHGILTNDQPGKPGQRWWFVRFLKARTLWQAAHEKKLKTAAVLWPVTVGADIDFVIPEFWIERTGHETALDPIEKHSTPGLFARIARAYPSFPVATFGDREGLTATRYLLEREQPALTLVHIADLDGEEHETGAFSRHSLARLEYQDELLAWTLQALPPQTMVAIVSDHGFETSDRVFRPKAALAQAGLAPDAAVQEGLIGATSERAAAHFRQMIGGGVIAREVPMAEVRRMAPELGSWIAAFETARNITLSADAGGPALAESKHFGVHGLWPTRADYRASFVLWGPGVKPQKLPEILMLDLAPTFAEILGLDLPDAQGRSLWPRLH
ncbi:MAG TPA: alkaline phosphatase family protein [Bryobacterales bacterium]|nr:alkaline phosphatase family protein [Bryobacterales bacterium]